MSFGNFIRSVPLLSVQTQGTPVKPTFYLMSNLPTPFRPPTNIQKPPTPHRVHPISRPTPISDTVDSCYPLEFHVNEPYSSSCTVTTYTLDRISLLVTPQGGPKDRTCCRSCCVSGWLGPSYPRPRPTSTLVPQIKNYTDHTLSDTSTDPLSTCILNDIIKRSRRYFLTLG